MGVVKRGNSKYWYIQFQLNGRTYIRSSRTTDKRAAEQMEREWRRQLHAQEYLGARERVTIGRVLEEFCISKKGTPNHRTLESNRKAVTRLVRTNRYFNEITSETIERLKRDRLKEGCGPATIKHTFNLIRGAWKYAKRMGYQVSDFEYPVVTLPKPRLRYLSVEEEQRLLKELDPRREGFGIAHFEDRPEDVKRFQQDAYDIVVLLLDTGARYGEIAGLEWRQVSLADRAINLWRPKVENESVLYMTDRVYRVLARRHQQKDAVFVFTNKKGEKRGSTTASIRKAFQRAGLEDCTIHTLRHTLATRLIQNGMSIYEVKEILGHADIKTTMRYAHLERRDVSSKARDVINSLNKQTEKPNLKLVD